MVEEFLLRSFRFQVNLRRSPNTVSGQTPSGDSGPDLVADGAF